MWWLWPDPLEWYECVSKPAEQALPPGYVVHMPRNAPRPHMLGDAVIVPRTESISGYEQHEKTCTLCSAVRVTVIPDKGEA